MNINTNLTTNLKANIVIDGNFNMVSTEQLIGKMTEWKEYFDAKFNPERLNDWYHFVCLVEEIPDLYLKNHMKLESEKIEKIKEAEYFKHVTIRTRNNTLAERSTIMIKKVLITREIIAPEFLTDFQYGKKDSKKSMIDDIENPFDSENGTKYRRITTPMWYKIEQDCYNYWEKFGFKLIYINLCESIYFCRAIAKRNKNIVWTKDYLALSYQRIPWEKFDEKKTLTCIYEKIKHVYKKVIYL